VADCPAADGMRPQARGERISVPLIPVVKDDLRWLQEHTSLFKADPANCAITRTGS
jgi:hypothetical protein